MITIFTGCSKKLLSNAVVHSDIVEVVSVAHDGMQFVPSTIKLAKWKNYSIEVTPSSDGRGCMTEVVIPGKGPHTIKQGEKFVIDVDGSGAKTIPLVCASMGMKQWEIIVE